MKKLLNSQSKAENEDKNLFSFYIMLISNLNNTFNSEALVRTLFQVKYSSPIDHSYFLPKARRFRLF